MKTLTQMKKNEEGFTLIELMIVLIVLGILAGLILFAVGPFESAAKSKVSEADADTCNTADAAASAGVSTAGMFDSGSCPP